MELVYFVLILVLFALSWGFVKLCERIDGSKGS
jgi:hypothetical protein